MSIPETNNQAYAYHPGELLPGLDGHISRGRFERVLRNGDFAVTAELAPPDSTDRNEVFEQATLFDGFVDAINATDGSGANCHMSSVVVCALLSYIGYSPIMQISCRDRNRIAIQGDLLGAGALSVCNVLALTGDDVSAGDHPEAKRVFDLDSISLITLIKQIRDEGSFLSGRTITNPPQMFVGTSINPFVPPVESRILQLEKKINAGADFIQTQYCFDMPMFKDFMSKAVDKGLTEKAFFLPGVGTLASARTARWIKNNVPGVHIPDSIFKRLEGAQDQKKEGQKICTELMQQVKEIEGVSGVHVMAYKQEECVAQMVQDSGVLGDRKPWSPKDEY